MWVTSGVIEGDEEMASAGLPPPIRRVEKWTDITMASENFTRSTRARRPASPFGNLEDYLTELLTRLQSLECCPPVREGVDRIDYRK